MFTPFTLRGVTLKNRVVVSPMAQYSCVDGVPGDYHLVHLGARAMGGAGMVVAEMTCASPDARITPACPGLWNDRAARRPGSASSTSCTRNTRRRRSRCSSATPAPRARRACRGKARTSRCAAGNWPLISASPQQYLDGVSDWSRAMTRADMDRVRDDFVRATRLRRRGGLRLARAALRARLPAVVVHLAAHQPAHRRVRRLAREPAALSARGLRARCARSGRERHADLGAHLRARLGRRAASRPTTRSRSRAPSRPPAPT